MPKFSFTLLHADHGLEDNQLVYVERVLQGRSLSEGFFIEQITLPHPRDLCLLDGERELGFVQNALYGPACGDLPVPEKEVFYHQREDRPYRDRMIDRPFRPTQLIQAIGSRAGNEITLYTVYGGPRAPQHPDDPSNADPEFSRQFWNAHALATGRSAMTEVEHLRRERAQARAEIEHLTTENNKLQRQIKKLTQEAKRHEDLE